MKLVLFCTFFSNWVLRGGGGLSRIIYLMLLIFVNNRLAEGRIAGRSLHSLCPIRTKFGVRAVHIMLLNIC
jgi:hypothetical protein